MHEALEVEQPAADLRSRVLSTLPANEPRMRRVWTLSGQWAIGFVAVLLAGARNGGVLFSRRRLPLSPAPPPLPQSGLPAHGRHPFNIHVGPPGGCRRRPPW